MGKSIKDLANKLSQWVSAFDNQLKDIGQEIKDKSITLDHQIKAIEARLDDSLDDSPDSSLYESYSEIFIDKPDENLDTNLDESLDTNLDESLDESLDNILYENYSEIFVDRLDDSLDTNLDEGLDDSLDTNLDTNLDESLDNTTINGKKHGSAAMRSLREIEPAIKQWLTLKEILSQRRKNWPKSIEGLRKKAIREGWPRRDRENRKEYQIPVANWHSHRSHARDSWFTEFP